jgi:hypothetical protein
MELLIYSPKTLKTHKVALLALELAIKNKALELSAMEKKLIRIKALEFMENIMKETNLASD